MRDPMSAPTPQCECGSTEGPFTVDVAGLMLCPSCASDSTVRCDICGDDAPVCLYAEGGGLVGDVLTVGHPNYLAVCRICDSTKENPWP